MRAHWTPIAAVGLFNSALPFLLFAFALSWMVATIGLGAPNGEAAQAAIFPMLFPLTFASSAFVDPSFMPGWLQVFADHQPVSITVDAARDLVLGQPVGWGVAASVAWSLGIVAVFGPLTLEGVKLSPRERAVLSVLVLRAGRPVTTAELADALSRDEPPGNP